MSAMETVDNLSADNASPTQTVLAPAVQIPSVYAPALEPQSKLARPAAALEGDLLSSRRVI